MTRRSAWLWSTVAVALAAATVVILVVSRGGDGGSRSGAAPHDPSGASARGEDAPGEVALAGGAESDGERTFADDDPSSPAVARLRGRVVEAGTGAPVAGARVRSTLAKTPAKDGEAAGARTRADGAFELRVSKTGSMRVRVTHEQFVAAASEPLFVESGATIDVPVLVLGRGGALEGVAIGEGEKPMAGARVSASFADDAARGATVESSKGAQTDSSGAFRIEGLAPGLWRVSVTPVSKDPADALAMQRKAIHGTADVIAGQTARVAFAAPPKGGCTVRGRVTRGGTALAKANLQIMTFSREKGADPSLFGRLAAQTDENGAFAIEHVPPGLGILGCTWSPEGDRSAGAASQSFQFQLVVPDATEHVVELAVPVGGEIQGRVVRRGDGKPIQGVSVSAQPERPQGAKSGAPQSASSTPSAQTDADGRYVLRGVTPGPVRVTASHVLTAHGAGDAESARLSPQTRKGVEAVEGGSLTIDFALEVGATVVVTVIDGAGGPVRDQAVQLLPVSKQTAIDLDAMRWGNTDDEGVARIQGVAPGTYVATASVKGAPTAYSKDFEAAVGADAAVGLEAREGVELRVSAVGPDGAPARILGASLLDARNRVASSWFPRRNDEATNRVTMRALPGAYKLTVSGDGLGTTLDVTVGDKPAELSVRLDKIAR